MNAGWWLVLSLGVVTVLFKGGGVLWQTVVGNAATFSVPLFAPAVLAGLVATQTLTDGRMLALDGRVVGVLVGATMAWKGLPLLLCVSAAAVTAALWRLAGLPRTPADDEPLLRDRPGREVQRDDIRPLVGRDQPAVATARALSRLGVLRARAPRRV